jgi:hypothetical protein
VGAPERTEQFIVDDRLLTVRHVAGAGEGAPGA